MGNQGWGGKGAESRKAKLEADLKALDTRGN